ncbi:aldehyde dehydrogenase [Streptomyces sp. NPDC097610]|uniref:aldehyde dehydrogenase n=1 Tax=Streptomyces sp. NPDC097610 TaxID=3157227 RepID=UPI0033269411
MHKFEHFFIDGQWQDPASDRTVDVVSPSTRTQVGRAPLGVEADIDTAVAAARRAFDDGPWPRMTPAERGVILRRLAEGLMASGEKIADVMTDEVGTTRANNLWIGQAGAGLLHYYAEMAEKDGVEEVRNGLNGTPFTVRHEPVGVVAAIVPWNSPLFLLMAKIAPALAAGCTIVAKAPEETPLEFYPLALAAKEADLPAGVLNIVTADREVSEYLVRHAGIDKVSFTGSTAAGRRIASICGNDIKRASLELGGKSAAIVLDDASPDTVVQYALAGGIVPNNGQACMALTRILLPRARYDEFAAAITAAVKSLKVGDPWAEDTRIGPLISERQRDRVEGYIEAGLAEGAHITTGGGRPEGLENGWYVEPTVFTGVDNSMKIAQEEIFGPVLVLIAHDGDDDAIRLADDSIYGLGGAVFTEDPARGFEVARAVRTGSFGLNSYGPDFGAPGGGFKASGIGREMGAEGFGVYRETKTIYGVDPART